MIEEKNDYLCMVEIIIGGAPDGDLRIYTWDIKKNIVLMKSIDDEICWLLMLRRLWSAI